MSFILCCLLTHNAQAVVGEDWQWINPYPSGNTVQDVIWDGGQFISVSTDVKTSPDGKIWSLAANVSGRAIAYSGSLYVLVGLAGSIQTSPDLVNWTDRVSGVSAANYFVDIIWNGEQFSAVTYQGDVVHSSDGVSWSLFYVGKDRVGAIVYSGSQYVIAAYRLNGTSVSSDGETWTVQTNNGFFKGLATNGAVYVAVSNGGNISSSSNGSSWTVRTITDLREPWFTSVTWDGSLFIAVAQNDVNGSGSRLIWTSPDGISWTPRNAGTVNALWAVVGNGSSMVAVGNNGTVVTSSNGVNWDPAHFDTDLNVILWAGGQYVAAGTSTYDSSSPILTSPNGYNWTVHAAIPIRVNALAFNGSVYVAIGGVYIYTSSDALTWTEQVNPATTNQGLSDISWNGEMFVVVGSSGIVLTSNDGVNWAQQTSGTAMHFYTVIWAGDQFVAGGTNSSSTTLTSPDGITWTAQTGGFYIWDLAWDGSQLVAATNGTSILTSPDGSTWTMQTTPSADWLNDVTWTGSQFVAVGRSGDIITSVDAITWAVQVSGTSNRLNHLISSDTDIIAVGEGGTMLASFAGQVQGNEITFDYARKVKPSQVDPKGFPEVDVYMNILGLHGSIIPGLSTADVCGVTENGQAITNFDLNTATGLSLNFSIVLDRSGSFDAQQTSLNQAASTLIGLMSTGDKASVVNFGSSTSVDAALTIDSSALINAVNNPSNVGSSTALYDGIVNAVSTLAGLGGQRAIFVVTDGEDTASSASLQEAINAATTEGIPVYPIGFGSGVDTSVLTQIASSTNGDFFASATTDELTSAITELRTLMANQYVLSYASIDTVTNGPREVIICIDKADEDLIVNYSMPEGFGETPADDPVTDDPVVDDPVVDDPVVDDPVVDDPVVDDPVVDDPVVDDPVVDDPVVDDPVVDVNNDTSNPPEPSPSSNETASSGGGGLSFTWLMLFMFASCVRRLNKRNG